LGREVINIKYDDIEFKEDDNGNSDEFNRYLLYKYATKQLISTGLNLKQAEKQAQEMIISHSNNLFGNNSLAVQLAQVNFEFFCVYYLQDTFIPKDNNTARNLAPVHLQIWKELQKMFIEDKYDNEEFILPRGCSKSTIINKTLSCYIHCFNKSRYTIVIGNKEDDAVQFVADTRKILGNKYIVKSFGKLIDKKTRTVNKQELELTNNSKISAFSWGSSVRGTTYGCVDGIFRPSVVICDDVLSEDDILSDGAKEKVLNKYYKEITEVGDSVVIRDGKKIKSASKFIIIGTPLAPDDFINTIREDATFKVFHKSVVNFDVDKYFEENKYWQHYKTILMNTKIPKEDKDIMLKEYYLEHKRDMEFPTIWEKYECDKLSQKYFNKRTAFLQELMCDCKNIGEKWFKSIRKQSVKEIESNTFLKTMLCVDPASTTGRNSDYSAFVVGSKADNDFKYVRKGIIEKLSFNNYCNKVIKLLKDYSDITYIYVEKNTYQGSDLIKIKELIAKDNELKRRNFTFINEMQRKNKDQKISAIVDDVNSGSIIFNKEDEEFINQFKEFSGQMYSLHDDSNDAVAEFVHRIDSIEVIQKIKILDRRKLGL
jgi:predicted phage terminase large subunit-like protein